MRTHPRIRASIHRGPFAVLLICLLATAAFLLPGTAAAEGSASSRADDHKTVRVGWYESPFNTTDKAGRRSGYAYEYQLKLAAYTGWDYTYVSGSWSDLMQMLVDGEIDLMSDVSYTEERAASMLFPELPMGTEEYVIFVSPGSTNIDPEDYATLDGRRVGVDKGSVQVSIFQDWAERHGIEAELVELSCGEEASVAKLESGELDAFITINAYGDPSRLEPVCKIGSSDFYFAVGVNRPDLLEDLNAAMSRIQDENPYYNERMYERYVQSLGSNAFLGSAEKAWLASHGTIRVGYQNNYLAFCAEDPTTGELTGALRDYLEDAADCLANAHLDFSATAYPTASSALEALGRGEVDCVFPANLSGYESEQLGLSTTPSLMRTEVFAVVRQGEQDEFAGKAHVVVAVNEGNPNYDAFLQDHFPEWHKVYYANTDACLEAVSNNVADCVLISSYRYNNISRLCERHHLATLSTGLGLDFCFAVAGGQTELYSILAKAANLVPSSNVNTALSYYMTEDAKRSLEDILADNIVLVLAAVAAVVLVILALLARSMRTERRARELISATEIDELTSLYSRNYFFQYANRTYRDHPREPRDAIVLNIEQFHTINALNGREFGDRVLRILGNELGAIAEERGGIAGRFGADGFDLYLPHTGDYRLLYDRIQGKLLLLAPNASVRLRMGVMPWQEGVEPVRLFDQARTACNMARGHFKEHLIVFDDEVRDRELHEQRLLNDLRRALDGFEFEVYYQPKYDVSGTAPRLVGAEALIRWQHPELGMIAPDDFIPLLERNGRVEEVDKSVWSQAARQIALWRSQFGITMPVSVNLSRVDVFDPMLERTLDAILAENGLSHDAFRLEVTESAYTEDAEQVIEVVTSLRRKGYTIEMDDFGTGYSSLSMLSAMPIDVLKMDKGFIQNMESDERNVQLVLLILGIAKSMGIPAIAEGVETESQLTLLKELGCTLVQGYYFSRPLHPSDFESTILQDMYDES